MFMNSYYNFLALLCLLLALAALSGCSVNVVVAPHATFAVDSLNERTEAHTATQVNESADSGIIPILLELYE